VTTHARIPIWPNGVPGNWQWQNPETETHNHSPSKITIVRNVVEPSIEVYLPEPERATGTAVVVAPGGAFHLLAIHHEGYDVARWLNERGIAAFVLRYRVIQTPADDAGFQEALQRNMSNPEVREKLFPEYMQIAIDDGLQAMRVVRQRAAEWGVDPERVGVMGFSAGGVLTIGVASQYDAESRPAFAAPIYPPYYAVAEVPADAPPVFIAVAGDDHFAISGCIPFYTTWSQAGKSAELHIYAQGGHGFGMFQTGIPTESWIERFGDWLKYKGF
jgi:acetyl esterase/lipase